MINEVDADGNGTIVILDFPAPGYVQNPCTVAHLVDHAVFTMKSIASGMLACTEASMIQADGGRGEGEDVIYLFS